MEPNLSRHHRKCKSNKGTNNPSNLVYVPLSHHRAFHTLFGNSEAQTIAQELTEKWIDPEWEIIARRRQ